MKKIIISVFVFLFLMNLVSASFLPHKQFQPFDLIISSNNASACNLTYVQYPDNTKTLASVEMTQNERDFTHQVDAGNFTQLGTTCMGVSCSDGSKFQTGSVCREVTPDGLSGTLGFYILILILSIGIILLGFYAEDPIIVILGSFGLYFIGLYILFNGIVGIKDSAYTWGLGIIVLMVAAYISARSSYEAFFQ